MRQIGHEACEVQQGVLCNQSQEIFHYLRLAGIRQAIMFHPSWQHGSKSQDSTYFQSLPFTHMTRNRVREPYHIVRFLYFSAADSLRHVVGALIVGRIMWKSQ